jgi:3-mercaptopyruvate sulfurtransferase SseA
MWRSVDRTLTFADAVRAPRALFEFVADPASPRRQPGLDPTHRVIVYCSRVHVARARSQPTLKTLGYQDVETLDGGFSVWKKAGLPIDEHHSDI